jgi:hypothetical protein
VASGGTLLSIQGQEFTLNGKPTFLLGFSYYGALGARQTDIESDLNDAQHFGFNWLRVWATWNAFDQDISAVAADGTAREPFMGKLRRLVSECDRRGLAVDITLTRGDILTNLITHQQAVATLVEVLKPWRNWYLDLANEHDVGDARYVSVGELKRMREWVRELDPKRLVTATFGGHDLTESDVRDALLTIGLDFLAPHRPRTAQSPRETESRTRELRELMRRAGRAAPIDYQEPFRRGYPGWQPGAEDFANDLQAAREGGAAAWCFHNGQQSNTADKQPRRSFDLSNARLFSQLDDVEKQVVRQIAARPNQRPSSLR